MEKKIEIKICVGTLCYIMGNAELQLLQEKLPQQFRDRVRISTSTCLNHCYDLKDQKPPFVEINGEVVAQASTSKVINILKDRYKNGIQ